MTTYGAILASMDPNTLLEHIGDQTGQDSYTDPAEVVLQAFRDLGWQDDPATLDGDVIRNGRTGCAEFQVVR